MDSRIFPPQASVVRITRLNLNERSNLQLWEIFCVYSALFWCLFNNPYIWISHMIFVGFESCVSSILFIFYRKHEKRSYSLPFASSQCILSLILILQNEKALQKAGLRLLVSAPRNCWEPGVCRSAVLWPDSGSSSVRVQQEICQRVHGPTWNPNCTVESLHQSWRSLPLHYEVNRR